jgi:peptidyl-prolyl cis-trans isomerase A (cyclophilin A)
MMPRLRRSMRACSALALLVVSGCAPWPPKPDPAHPQVLLETSAGDIRLELDPARAPKSVANFLRYLREGHYDGTLFHRVIAGFVIQGGGYDSALHERPTHAPIPLEANNGLSNLRGTLAMAREDAPDTATAEFYINLTDNLKLDPHPENPQRRWGYAVFGRVVAGMDTVDRIAAVPTGAVGRFEQDTPLQPVLLLHALLLPAASAP